MRSGGGFSPEASTTHNSPATRLPLEVAGTIIVRLAYDKSSLRACTLTCYSWYIAAVPYPHCTLTVNASHQNQIKYRWPNHILYMHTFGLLPLIEEFRILGDGYSSDRLSLKLFNCSIIRKLSALTNVRYLEIQSLEIPQLMPRIKRYFRSFLSTVRSLTLREPKGSRRQIIYFTGLFQQLQDLKLHYDGFNCGGDPAGDPAFTPALVPPLRG